MSLAWENQASVFNSLICIIIDGELVLQNLNLDFAAACLQLEGRNKPFLLGKCMEMPSLSSEKLESL